ncbi:MAG: peptidoglycan-binding protein [Acidimicrobiales bacterium]
MSSPGLPLTKGSAGTAVRDLHRRLQAAGETVSGVRFTSETELAVRRFQASRGLVVDGICGPQTWSALVEAAHRLGDRMLYLRYPMTRGDDVTELQRRLGSLGFDAGWIDGIFGPDSQRAVREFQLNSGLGPDGVVGHATVAALDRLAARQAGTRTVAAVREVETLRHRVGDLACRRIVIGEAGGIPSVALALGRQLRSVGAEVLDITHPDPSEHARRANNWTGDLYLGVTLASSELSVAYFATSGFESAGGRELAGLCAAALAPVLGVEMSARGMRIPILRETRMAAVWCRLGPPPRVVEKAPFVADVLRHAVVGWCRKPVEEPSSTG